MNDALLALADTCAWYALWVPPQKEFAAQEILHKRDVPTFVPVRREWRRKHHYTREKQLVAYPAVPRYVFAGFRAEWELLRYLHRLPLIEACVGLNGAPYRFPGQQIAALIRHLGRGINAPSVQRFMPTHKEFAVGDTVEVMSGPFADRKVPIIEIHGARAKGLVTMFGATMEVELPVGILQVA